MAIPVEQLKAFAGGGPELEPMPGGEAPLDEGAETANPADDRFAALLPLLEAAAPDIMELCDDIDPDVLTNPDAEPDEALLAQVRDGFETLDQEFQDAAKSAFAGGVSEEEASALADHLMQEALIDDPERFAGWVMLAADATAEADAGGDEETPDDEEPAEGGDEADLDMPAEEA